MSGKGTSSEDKDVWDDDLARRLLGSEVLVGITRRSGDVDAYEQCFGVVEVVDRSKGVLLRLSGKRRGEPLWFPPDLRTYEPARPGEYRLRSTGEVVIDPDFLATWTIVAKVN